MWAGCVGARQGVEQGRCRAPRRRGGKRDRCLAAGLPLAPHTAHHTPLPFEPQCVTRFRPHPSVGAATAADDEEAAVAAHEQCITNGPYDICMCD